MYSINVLFQGRFGSKWLTAMLAFIFPDFQMNSINMAFHTLLQYCSEITIIKFTMYFHFLFLFCSTMSQLSVFVHSMLCLKIATTIFTLKCIFLEVKKLDVVFQVQLISKFLFTLLAFPFFNALVDAVDMILQVILRFDGFWTFLAMMIPHIFVNMQNMILTHLPSGLSFIKISQKWQEMPKKQVL